MPLQIIRDASGVRGRPVPPSAGDDELVNAYLVEFRRLSGLMRLPVTLRLLGAESGLSAERSLRLGVRAASIYLSDRDVSITLCVPEGSAREITESSYGNLREYIAARYNGFDGALYNKTFFRSQRSPRTPRTPRTPPMGMAANVCASMPAAAPLEKAQSLEEMLHKTDAGFSETLLKLIDRAGKKDSEVYKRANIDRKLFSKIRSNPSYRPSKSTALALAFALELDLQETRDLIGRAGYTLTHASRGDIIVEYFIVNGKFDIFELNETLFAFDQPLLGGA